jgi:hypothetical protein
VNEEHIRVCFLFSGWKVRPFSERDESEQKAAPEDAVVMMVDTEDGDENIDDIYESSSC